MLQMKALHQENLQTSQELDDFINIIKQNNFETHFFGTVRVLQYNPFWSMILYTIQYSSMDQQEPSVQFAPFLRNPKNLITDQLPTNDMADILLSLSQFAVQEGFPCFASGPPNPPIYLPVLQSARFADHAPPTMAGNRNYRLELALVASQQSGGDQGVYEKLINGAIGNPLYALKIATYETSSTGYAVTTNLAVIQEREPFSPMNERDPALLFGAIFTEMV
ncbi:unnamed protein product, partial [marine sediment metagenome]